jgi:asparagine synthase (glutamine-hydrolysing)
MIRFLAFVWNPSCTTDSSEVIRLSQSLAHRSEVWVCALRIDGLLVFQTGENRSSSEVHILGEGSGIIVGRIFSRGNETQRVKFGRLIDTSWGRYVAFTTDTSTRTTRVIRSPAGALNCFHARSAGVRIFFSDVEDYTPLRSDPPSINWPWVATLLAYPRHAMGSSSTGISDLEQLQPGECLVCSPDGAAHRKLVWNPFLIASSDPIEDFHTAAAAIRSAAQSCIWSWAAGYSQIVLLLSGGLDSSIVLNCLSTAPTQPQITCVTYFAESCVTGDERAYARISAGQAGCRLLEVEEHASDTDLTAILRIAKHPVPWSYLLYVRHSAREGQIAANTNSSAIFSGTAGDQIFFYGPAVLAAADYLRRHGVFSGFIPYALSLARRNKLSLWSVLSTALQDRLTAPRYDAVRDNESPNRLITQEAMEEADRSAEIRHYWMPFAEGVPHGKLLHVLMTDCTQDLRDPLGSQDYPERVQPLNSQPLIETCLRIPTYVLTRAGWSRAAARSAFSSNLPSQIVSRFSKGYIDSQNADLLRRNLDMVRELLLDGHLASRRLIDRRKLERLLTPEQVRLSPEAGEALCEHLSYEVWLRNWVSTRAS